MLSVKAGAVCPVPRCRMRQQILSVRGPRVDALRCRVLYMRHSQCFSHSSPYWALAWLMAVRAESATEANHAILRTCQFSYGSHCSVVSSHEVSRQAAPSRAVMQRAKALRRLNVYAMLGGV